LDKAVKYEKGIWSERRGDRKYVLSFEDKVRITEFAGKRLEMR